MQKEFLLILLALNSQVHAQTVCITHNVISQKINTIIKPTYDVDGFPSLKQHNNHMAKVLKDNKALYMEMKDLGATEMGYTIDDVIRTGVLNPDHPYITTVGATAGDEESYVKFKKVFDPIITLRHNGFQPGIDLHTTDLSAEKTTNSILDQKYVLTTRVRAGRNIRGYRLPPAIHKAERTELEALIKGVLLAIDGEYSGRYKGIYEMTKRERAQCIDAHICFDNPISPLLIASRMDRDWPSSRGIFTSNKQDFIVWVNEEDHMRIISMQSGSDMFTTYKRWCDGVKKIETEMQKRGLVYQYSNELGYIHTCPSNLGTGLRCSVFLKVPLLSKQKCWKKLIKNLKLQVRGVGGVDTLTTGDVFDISNSDRLGYSETELVQLVVDGVNELIRLEKLLEQGLQICTGDNVAL